MLSLIAAVARNRAIGKDRRLLWHLPEDMRYFKEKTLGKPVIMGRKTWESLPAAFRPLPGRRNIVVSANASYPASGATWAYSIEQALTLTQDADETMIIGGAELYRQTLPLANRLYLTEVDQDYEADAHFPEIPATEWQEVSRRAGSPPAGGPAYDFVVYDRLDRKP
ncbi:MAG: dihydrofolate reductase [Candidatus Accumulibacter sp.]|nr:dihydrofolate reductase [Accumulibacter sp.]